MALIGNFNFLLSGHITSGAGANVMDVRRAMNYAYVEYVSYAPSAIIKLDASHDGTGWMTVATYTATPSTATASLTTYYPYVRGVYVTGWSTTASANLFYAAGLQSRLG